MVLERDYFQRHVVSSTVKEEVGCGFPLHRPTVTLKFHLPKCPSLAWLHFVGVPLGLLTTCSCLRCGESTSFP